MYIHVWYQKTSLRKCQLQMSQYHYSSFSSSDKRYIKCNNTKHFLGFFLLLYWWVFFLGGGVFLNKIHTYMYLPTHPPPFLIEIKCIIIKSILLSSILALHKCFIYVIWDFDWLKHAEMTRKIYTVLRLQGKKRYPLPDLLLSPVIL